jgi:hypothetical protein
VPLEVRKPTNFNNESYLLSCERGGAEKIKEQLFYLKTLHKPHPAFKGIVDQRKIDYEIAYLEYLLFWHNTKERGWSEHD